MSRSVLSRDLKLLEELKDRVSNGGNVTFEDAKSAVYRKFPETFIYVLEHLDSEEEYMDAIYTSFRAGSFFSNLIRIPNFDPLMRDGIILTAAKTHFNEGDKVPLELLMSKLKDQVINLDTESDIAKLLDIYVTQARDAYIYPIGRIYDPKIMIKYGFLPTSFNFNTTYFIDYINGVDLNDINFWHSQTELNQILNLDSEPRWLYNTLETHKHNSIISAISLPLLLYAPELVYKGSKRPVNDMSIYRSPVSYKIKRDQIRDNTVELEGDIWSVIPVTRYAAGMSRGLFYTENNDKTDFCGTFYYYEPESTTLLAYKTSGTFFNKYVAAESLNGAIDKYGVSDILLKLSHNNYLMAYINGKLPQDLMFTPDEYARYSYEINSTFINTSGIPSQSLGYGGGILYAVEDALDQPLCKLGKDNNLDLIILKSMPGSFQLVTEVLDTRSREDSFKSLIYIVD